MLRNYNINTPQPLLSVVSVVTCSNQYRMREVGFEQLTIFRLSLSNPFWSCFTMCDHATLGDHSTSRNPCKSDFQQSPAQISPSLTKLDLTTSPFFGRNP